MPAMPASFIIIEIFLQNYNQDKDTYQAFNTL